MEKVDLSITIIGHNEAQHLRELLPSLGWAKEIVYVDCESQDDSLQVARQAGCRTFRRPNLANLNVNKSFAIEQAGARWIFYLDPDERIPGDLAQEIQTLLKQPDLPAAFRVKRRNHYFGRWLRYGGQYPDWQLRLFQRGRGKFPLQHVHERLQVDGPIGQLKNDLMHYPYRNVSQFLHKFDFYTSFEAQFLAKNGIRPGWKNHLRFLVVKPFSRFVRRYFLKGGFLDGLPGLFAALFDALNFVVRYYKLWEMQGIGEK